MPPRRVRGAILLRAAFYATRHGEAASYGPLPLPVHQPNSFALSGSLPTRMFNAGSLCLDGNIPAAATPPIVSEKSRIAD
jgi:hypothetical protein